MSRVTRIAVSGAGGYGYYYLRELLDNGADRPVELVAVFDPAPDQAPIISELVEKGVQVYKHYEPFKEQLHTCDLAVIVSPIQFHAQQACDALLAGCHVLLDKPLAGSLEQAEQIVQAAKQVKQWLMVGYQWSYSKAILDLKTDLIRGDFGRINKAKTLIFWPRDYQYYGRNNWAGRKSLPAGEEVNDSPANNAMAHFIHNLLFLAGDSLDHCDEPLHGECELFRAYDIENYDTAVIRWWTKKGIEMLFFGSHVTRAARGPLFLLECEKASIYYGELSSDIIAVFNDGSAKHYGNPDDTPQFHKLWVAVDRCRGRETKGVSPEAAMQQTKLIQAVADHGVVKEFPANNLVLSNEDRRYVEGLGYMLLTSYQQGFMPSSSAFSIKGIKKEFTL